MKVLVLLPLFVACATAQYFYSGYPYATPYWGASQYHAQDGFGQASYGYAHPGQASATFRDAFGNQVGSYAYINPEGKEVRVQYVADANGFRVVSNNLPQAPTNDLQAPVFDGKAPEPVEDTAEVAAAKAEFFKLYKEAASAAAAAPDSRKKRQVIWPVAAVPAYAKAVVKTAYYEKDEAAKTPADTTKIDLKEKDQEVYTPLAYSAPVVAAAPVVATAPVVKAAYTYTVPAPYFGYRIVA